MYCKSCEKEVDPVLIQMGADSPHYIKAECSRCQRFIRWLPKPKNEDIRKRSRYTPDSLGINYCEICGRTRDTVGLKEVLEVHHKIPIDEGGVDEEKNILIVCSPCHRMCRWLRLYLNQHLNQPVSVPEDSSLPF